MERDRLESDSSADSWSLLDELDENNENNEDVDAPVEAVEGANLESAEEESDESIAASNQLPADFCPVLLTTSASQQQQPQQQHLLVVSTPASTSIVTQSGVILSPELSAQAFAHQQQQNDPLNTSPPPPAVVSSPSPPPSTPPIESTFTFLKDPSLRISFSDSCESREEDDEPKQEKLEEAAAEVDVKFDGNGQQKMDELLDQSMEESGKEEVLEVEEQIANNESKTDEKTVVTECPVDEEANKEEEKQNEGLDKVNDDELPSSELPSDELEMESSEADDVDSTDLESVFSSSHSSDSSSLVNKEEEEAKCPEEMSPMEIPPVTEQAGDEALEARDFVEIFEITDAGSLLTTSQDSLDVENDDGSSLPSMPSTTEFLSAIFPSQSVGDGSDLSDSGSTVSDNTGWTELGISTMSSSSSTEETGTASSLSNIEANPSDLVAKRLDELSEQMEEQCPLWHRLLDDTFCSLKHFERSDRIINILIVAMFLASFSSMTILHILENTWMAGTNQSASAHSPLINTNNHFATHPKGAAPKTAVQLASLVVPNEQQAQFMAKYEDPNQLHQHQQCKDELLQTKYQTKHLHYLRVKQEMLLDELRSRLKSAELALAGMEGRKEAQKFALSTTKSTTTEDVVDEEILRWKKIRAQALMSMTSTQMRAKKRSLQINALEKGKQVQKEETLEHEVDEQQPSSSSLSEEKEEENIIADPEQKRSSKKKHDDDEQEKDEDEVKADEGKESNDEHTSTGRKWRNLFAKNWRKYNAILQNLSTSTNRVRMLKRVRSAVVAQLNRTFEKTTTALAAATKLMTSADNFGKKLLTSTVDQLIAGVEHSATSLFSIVECLNNGLFQRMQQNMPFCTGPTLEDEEDDKAEEDDEAKEEDDDEADVEEERKKERVEEIIVIPKSDGDAKFIKEEKEVKVNVDGQNQRPVDWLLQRAVARANLRLKARGHPSLMMMANQTTQSPQSFARWLFIRAALRQKQREEQQQNGTDDNAIRSSLFRDDWMFALDVRKQKVRAKLRREQEDQQEKEEDEIDAPNDDWLFKRQRLRERARREQSRREEEAAAGEWLFARQKLRQKLREENKSAAGGKWKWKKAAERHGQRKWKSTRSNSRFSNGRGSGSFSDEEDDD